MISTQDFERLSTYLDNQLPSKEKAALETRLAHEPELRVALDELRQTVRALRSLPAVRPPRNFTLSARQVGAVSQRRLFPMLRLATSLAALALVLVFAGDLIAVRAPALSPAVPLQSTNAERNVAPSEAAPPAVAMGAAAAPTSMPTQVLNQSSAAADASAGASSSSPSAAPLPEAMTPLAPSVLAASPITTEPTVPAPAAEQPAATVGPSAAAKLAPTEAPATFAPTAAPATLAPTETFAPPTAEAYAPSTPEIAAAPVASAVSAPSLPWRAAEIGLISLTLFLAAFTWLMRRR